MNPLELYGAALHGARTRVRYEDGGTAPLEAPRWAADALPGDDALLERCGSATLDVGCGPGRLARALLEAGTACTGVDVAPAAVDLARARGAQVLHASVHDPLLDTTRWTTVLLADGNIGIGGDPVGLLRRASALLAPGGQVVVEADPPGTATRRVRIRLETRTAASGWFPWAHVAADDLPGVALAAGLHVVEAWQAQGRHLALLAQPAVSGQASGRSAA